MGIPSDNERALLGVLTFAPEDTVERLIELSAILCRSVDSNSSSITLILDEYLSSVRRADLSPLATNVAFTPTSVGFSMTADESVTFSIDRVTGQMTARGSDGVSAQWQCDRTEIGQRRF